MVRALAILWLLCTWCTSASAETLVLANGDTITGTIVEWDRDSVVFEHPQLGRIRLALEELAVETGDPPARGLFGTSFLRGWKRKIDIGLSGKQGNSENTNLTAGLDFAYEDDFKRWRLDGRYFFNRDEDGVSDNNARIDLRRDWLLPGKRWFGRVATRYQYDEFESWEHRITTLAGPGYTLIDREKHSLEVTFGPAFTREFGERNDNQGEAFLGLGYESKITKRLSLETANTFFVEYVPEGGDIRNVSSAELTVKLLEKPDLSLIIGGENEWESNPEADDESFDVRYYMSFALDF